MHHLSVKIDMTVRDRHQVSRNILRNITVLRFAHWQCRDRAADKTVYCSCRCADINGNQPSGQTFCTCPDGFSCTPLVTSIGAGNEGLTGSYCILNNTGYNKDTACNQGDCDPNTNKCGSR